MIRLLAVLLLSGCSLYARIIEHQRHDGTLACLSVYELTAPAHRFDLDCRYLREEGACECWVVDWNSKVSWPPVERFCVDFTQTLPAGLSWPHPKWYDELVEMEKAVAAEDARRKGER